MELYLITGFLGAGKTTFLREFARQFPGKRLWLIINEFGKAGVDGALLQQLDAVLSEITNGSIFCACRLDKFEEELARAAAQKPDVILVEASGLADPTSVQTVLGQPAFSAIHYRGSVCLVDTPRLEKVPYFTGILIHCGNKVGDTRGCILVGERNAYNTLKNSRVTFDRLYACLEAAVKAGEGVTITIE